MFFESLILTSPAVILLKPIYQDDAYSSVFDNFFSLQRRSLSKIPQEFYKHLLKTGPLYEAAFADTVVHFDLYGSNFQKHEI